MIAALMTGIELVHVDAHLVAINKPAGLLSVPGRGADKADCALTRVREIFPDALTVHRLDMATSGLLLFPRSAEVHRALSIQFEKRQVHKTYIAEVDGMPSPAEGLIDLPLIADWPNRPLQKVDTEIGKPSQTRYRTIASGGAHSRLALEPITGRSHQLRVHLAAIGHAILGDEFYAPPHVHAAAPRLQLHASRLEFLHPATGAAMVIESACPF